MRDDVALDGGLIQLRVRYAEVDRMGVAYHANHLVWFEVGRTELMRAKGLPYARIEEEGRFLPVIEVSCTYHAAIHYDDLLNVRTVLADMRGARVTFNYRIERAPDGVLLATGSTTHAAVDRRGRPRRLPASLQELSR